jgi:hypothetical protein
MSHPCASLVDVGAAEQLAEAIDAVTASTAAAVDPEEIVELYRQLGRLHAAVARAAAVFAASGAWADDGARTPVAWLAATTRLPKAQLRSDVRLGATAPARFPRLWRAWQAGVVHDDHLRVVERACSARTEAAFEDAEELLTERAVTQPFDGFQRAVTAWRHMADADGCDERAMRRRDERDVVLVESFQGNWLGQMTLDPVSGSVVSEELRRLERCLFEADWASARQRLGHEPAAWDLERTSSQRRADALVTMAQRSGAVPPGARLPRPLFTVLVDHRTLIDRVCQLGSGSRVPVAPALLRPWLEGAEVERVVFGSGDRITVGSRRRLFSGPVRRAIEVRDGGCTHPFCDEPADRCEVDHVIPWSEGGSTSIDNGRLLCEYHHRLRHAPVSGPPPWSMQSTNGSEVIAPGPDAGLHSGATADGASVLKGGGGPEVVGLPEVVGPPKGVGAPDGGPIIGFDVAIEGVAIGHRTIEESSDPP